MNQFPPRLICLAIIALLAGLPAPVQGAPAPFANSLGMKFVPLPKTDVLFGVWETRNLDYAAGLKAAGLPVAAELTAKPDHPVRNVNWDEAAAFCNWLTVTERKLGRIGATDRYRLPNDREWSAAVGSVKWPWGDSWPTLEQRAKLPGYQMNDTELTTKVGSFLPNSLGIHDLGGNVMEWLHDWYDSRLNSSELRIEFKRLEDDGGGRKYRMLRGQSWAFFDTLNLQAGYRYPNLQQVRAGHYGFRVVLEREAGTRIIGPAVLPKWNPPPAFDRNAVLGRALYVGRCNECHQHFDPATYDDESWSHWIGQMRGKAKLGAVDADLVGRFISTVRTGKY